MPTPTSDLLSGLLAQVHDAWTTRRDTSTVQRLASQYPDYADALYDYLDLLVELDLDDRSPDTRGRVAFAENVREWRDERFPSSDDCEGLPSKGPETQPQPVLGLVKKRTGLRAKQIKEQTGLRPAFLTTTNKHAQHMPPSWCGEIARRFKNAFGIPADDTKDAYHNGYRTERQAASRDEAIETHIPSPEEVLDMCGMTDPEERAYWLWLAEIPGTLEDPTATS